MEMHQLRYFVAVAREGNFTRAARACHVSQPSLSQQIRKLEDEVGQSLLHRLKSGKSVLSPAGELFFPRAVRILQEAKLAASELDHINASVSGSVRMGAIPTLAPYLVPDAVLGFNRDYPAVELVVHETTTTELLAMLWRNELDFALASPPFPGGPWAMQTLGTERLLLATAATDPQQSEGSTTAEAENAKTASKGKALTPSHTRHGNAAKRQGKGNDAAAGNSPETSSRTLSKQTGRKKSVKAAMAEGESTTANTPLHPSPLEDEHTNHLRTDGGAHLHQIKNLRLSDLSDEAFILMREGHCLSNQVIGFCQQADFKPKVRFLSAQVETLKALIRAGAGVSLLPALAVDHSDPTLSYLALHDNPAPQREIVALWRPEFPLSRASTEFIRYVRDGLEKRLAQ